MEGDVRGVSATEDLQGGLLCADQRLLLKMDDGSCFVRRVVECCEWAGFGSS